VTLASGKLSLAPLMPAEWSTFKLIYRHGDASYAIRVTRVAEGQAGLSIDGVEQADHTITLLDDGREHAVELRLI
jgi:cyclic beta-1,2-glucan synthetase